MELCTKLNMAKYTTACNENALNELKSLRQAATFALYQNIHPNLSSAVFNKGAKAIAKALKIQTQCPWIKTCNQKLVLVMPLCNQNHDSLEEIQILLHGCKTAAMTYTTKLYQSNNEAPYWREIKTQSITKNTLSSVAAVIDLRELEPNVINRIDFGGVIMYKIDGNEKLLPFEKISLSMMDTLAEKYEVLSSTILETTDILAILATSQKTDVIFRQVQNEDGDTDTLTNLLSIHLKMERVTAANNLLVVRNSPHHVLNGLMIVFHGEMPRFRNNVKASVYSRSESQVLSLIHYISASIPERIIITGVRHKTTLLNQDLMMPGYHDELTTNSIKQLNLQPLALSMLKQTSTLLEYYDNCMMKMNESKNENLIQKIGCEIDVFACGVPKFIKMKDRLNEAMLEGILKVNSE